MEPSTLSLDEGWHVPADAKQVCRKHTHTDTHTPLSHINSFTRKLSHTHTTLSAFPILLSHLFCAYWKKLTYGVLRSFNFAGFHHSFGSPKWCVLGPPWSTVVLPARRAFAAPCWMPGVSKPLRQTRNSEVGNADFSRCLILTI